MEDLTSAGTPTTNKIQITGINISGKDRNNIHSHIRGLGLNEDGQLLKYGSKDNSGMIGQKNAREACGVVVDMIKEQKMGGRGVLLVGPPGTGKTALAMAMAQEIGAVPFTSLVGSEVYSAEVKKTEILMEAVRRSIALRMKETKQVYEGEVTQLDVIETEGPLAGFGKTISRVILTLKSQKGTKTLKLDPSLLVALQKESVRLGDIMYLETESGAVKRVGRSDAFRSEVDLEAEWYVPLPKGEVFKTKELEHVISLHDLDTANARPSQSATQDRLMEAFMGMAGNSIKKKTEITEKLRNEINRVVNQYVEQGTAEILPGVLLIDEAHLLDVECFTFLNRIMESPMSPMIVLATNRGLAPLRMSIDHTLSSREESNLLTPHGLPLDFLDRLLIIRTEAYLETELKGILEIRACNEGIQLEEAALQMLTQLAATTTLRRALQLLLPSQKMASIHHREVISVSDIQETRDLFL